MTPELEIEHLKSLLQECLPCVEENIKFELLHGDYRKARMLQHLRESVLGAMKVK